MNEMGMAMMGTGIGQGEGRAIEAATKAISSPLLDDISIKGATGILINITGGSDMTLFEISEASKIIQEEADENANILFGAVIDEALRGEVRVTVIATGFNKVKVKGARPTATAQPAHVTPAGLYVTPQTAQMVPLARVAAPAPAPEHRSQPGIGLQAHQAAPAPAVRQATFPSGASRHAPSGGMGLASAFEGASAAAGTQEVRGELKDIAREIGVLEFQNDEYDIPTFLRKQAD